MKIYNIGSGEIVLIEEALEVLEDINANALKNKMEDEVRNNIEYNLAHIRTTRTLMRDQRLQELCERCLSYFWDRLSAEGIDNPDVEYLADEMGIGEDELKELFREAGYEEE